MARAGLRTVKNLLATALAPMGTTLYVYGGGWDLNDAGAGPEARRIGVSPAWRAFFCRQDAAYAYRDEADPENRFYPRDGKNRFHWAGLDCSGYLGWAVYNTLHGCGGGPGYVGPAAAMAADFARRGWGALVPDGAALRPGDVCSISGHVWLSLGTCGDGSVLLAHSTPSPSFLGRPGGGVQLSAIGPSGKSPCRALALARAGMARFPAWTARYEAVETDRAIYMDFSQGGHFRWSPRFLADPEGLAELDAERVLSAL